MEDEYQHLRERYAFSAREDEQELNLNQYQFQGGSLDGLSVEMPTPPNGTEFRLPNRTGQRFREVYEFSNDSFVFKKRALGTFGDVPKVTCPALVIDEEHRRQNEGAAYKWDPRPSARTHKPIVSVRLPSTPLGSSTSTAACVLDATCTSANSAVAA